MKKSLLTLLLIFGAFTFMNAQSWKETAEEYADLLNSEMDLVTDTFSQMGINATGSAHYNASTNQIVMDLNFEPVIWDFFDKNAMDVARSTTLEEYQNSYKTDADFKEVIDEMKANGASFKIEYTCLKNGEIQVKSFTITPKEIIR